MCFYLTLCVSTCELRRKKLKIKIKFKTLTYNFTCFRTSYETTVIRGLIVVFMSLSYIHKQLFFLLLSKLDCMCDRVTVYPGCTIHQC